MKSPEIHLPICQALKGTELSYEILECGPEEANC